MIDFDTLALDDPMESMVFKYISLVLSCVLTLHLDVFQNNCYDRWLLHWWTSVWLFIWTDWLLYHSFLPPKRRAAGESCSATWGKLMILQWCMCLQTLINVSLEVFLGWAGCSKNVEPQKLSGILFLFSKILEFVSLMFDCINNSNC